MIGYKKCQPFKNHKDRVIGIFEIFNDSLVSPKITNEYSIYRTNKCRLIGVEDLEGNQLTLNVIEPVRFLPEYDSNVVFKMNEITEIDSFDENQKIIGRGIWFFLNKKRAVLYLIDNIENGNLIKWRDNGIIYSNENFLNFKKEGICKYYHNNGNIRRVCEYDNNILNNFEYIYDIDGHQKKMINHVKVMQQESNYKT